MSHTSFQLDTPHPCTQDWHSMSGDAQYRHCADCTTTVHNLAALPRKQVELLAMKAAAGQHVCARVTRDASGEVVTQPDPYARHSFLTGSVVLSAALAAGLPAHSQSVSPKPEARVTGRLLKPDGSPVDTGLIYLASSTSQQWYVADSTGRFEFRLPPGSYDFGVQTGPQQSQRITLVQLHEGEQSFGDVRTEAGRGNLMVDVNTTTGGVLVGRVNWSWRGRLRHPVLYVRSIIRRRS